CYVSAEHQAEMLGDGEAQSRAAEALGCRRVGLRERLEQLLELIRRHSDASIRDLKADGGAVGLLAAPDLERYLAVSREFGAVAEQVEKTLLDLGQIRSELADVIRADYLELVVVLGDQRANDRLYFAHERCQIERLEINVHPARLDLRQVENVIDDS